MVPHWALKFLNIGRSGPEMASRLAMNHELLE